MDGLGKKEELKESDSIWWNCKSHRTMITKSLVELELRTSNTKSHWTCSNQNQVMNLELRTISEASFWKLLGSLDLQ
jgi:hypothetical protein